MVLENYITNDYLRALIIAVILLGVIRIFVSIGIKIAKQFTSKTKTTLDDELFARSATPATIAIFVLAIQIAINELPLTVENMEMVNKVVYSFFVLVLGYLAYIIIDLTALKGLQRFAKRTKTKVDENLASLVNSTLKITMIALALLYILDLWGIEIGPLLAGLGIAGLAVALALQPTLSNVFSGISMILDKSLRLGDLVYLDTNTKGTVDKIGFRSTRIKTFDNELIIVPNNKLAESQIQNVALPEPKSRVVIPFGVAYGSDVDKVKELITREIKTITNVEEDPEPMVRFLEMGDSALLFKAYFYVDTYEHRFNAIDEANTKIYKALNKAKISIPFPQMDIHLFDESRKR